MPMPSKGCSSLKFATQGQKSAIRPSHWGQRPMHVEHKCNECMWFAGNNLPNKRCVTIQQLFFTRQRRDKGLTKGRRGFPDAGNPVLPFIYSLSILCLEQLLNCDMGFVWPVTTCRAHAFNTLVLCMCWSLPLVSGSMSRQLNHTCRRNHDGR